MVNSITLDGYDIMNDGLFIEGDELESPFSSGYKRNVLTLPGRPGAIHLKDEVNPIQFDFKLSYVGDDQLDLQQSIRKLKKRLIDNDGKPKVIKLICSWEPDIYYNVMLTDKEFDNKSKWQRISDYSLSFICYEGFGLLVQGDSLLWGDTEVPHGSYNYYMNDEGTTHSQTFSGTGNMVFENKGYNTDPIISISGSGTNINFICNGVLIKIPSLSNETLMINLVTKDIHVNNKINLEKISSMDWLDFKFIEGRNVVGISGTNLNVTVVVQFEERFY